MHTVPTDSLLERLRWRYATKKFDATKRVPAAEWKALEEALVLSPSSFGLQPWKFIVVTDAAVRARLVPATWGQTQPVDCSHFVVLAVRRNLSAADIDHHVERIAQVRGATKESLSGYRNVMVQSRDQSAAKGILDHWATRQVYIALGNLMTSAALLGIDTCPMEGFEPEKYDEILGLKDRGLGAVVCCAVGYRSADDKYATTKKVRFPVEEVILRV